MLFFTVAGKANAHFITRNGAVGAILHMDSDDDPVAGQKTGFHFDIKDSTNKFKPSECDCVVNIYEKEQLLYTYKDVDSQDGLYEINFKYVFPQKDLYKVELIGMPKTQDSFSEFKISYDVRVENEIKGFEKTIYDLSEFRGQILFSIVALLFALFIVFRKMSPN